MKLKKGRVLHFFFTFLLILGQKRGKKMKVDSIRRKRNSEKNCQNLACFCKIFQLFLHFFLIPRAKMKKNKEI